jgi:hypothetical protein
MNIMQKNTKNALWSLLLFVFAMPFLSISAQAETYVVVVNADNKANISGNEAIQQVRRVFLKESKDWPGGTEAVPFTGKKGSAPFTALLSGVLSLSETEYEAHWAKLKQTTGDTPPRAVGSVNILLKLIGRSAGAVGVVPKSKAASLPDGLKVLLEFEA